MLRRQDAVALIVEVAAAVADRVANPFGGETRHHADSQTQAVAIAKTIFFMGSFTLSVKTGGGG